MCQISPSLDAGQGWTLNSPATGRNLSGSRRLYQQTRRAQCGLATLFPLCSTSRGTPLLAQTVENLPAMQETQVRSLDSEDALEQEMATHSSILAWRQPDSLAQARPWTCSFC